MKGILKQLNITLILIIMVGAGAAALWHSLRRPAEGDTGTRIHGLSPARVSAIRDMVRLCTLDMYEEVAIKDTINGKGLFAVQCLNGTVSYDLTAVRIDSLAPDTLRVTLPEEEVQWLESTEPEAYRVLDVWNDRMPLLRASLTTAEENELKLRASRRLESLARERGYIKRARTSAVASLRAMYSLLPDVTVIVEE